MSQNPHALLRNVSRRIAVVAVLALFAAAGLTICLGAVSVEGQNLASGPRAIAGSEIRQEWVSQAYMPLVGRGMTLGMLVPPKTAVVPTETLPPSETPVPSATYTPVPSPTPTTKPLDAEEDNPRIALEGAWQQVSDTRASSGGYAVSRAEGDTLTVQFAGDHIVIYRMLAPDGGRAAVNIDGKSYGNLQCYFSERRYQVPAIIDNLPEGGHTLTLTVDDRSPSGSTGTAMYIDRLQAPGPYTTSATHGEALDRTNYYRDLMDLPRMRSDRAIHLAAQGHAEYDVQNPGGGHSEAPGRTGYIGTRFSDRMRYFGYDRVSSEVMYWSSRHTPAGAVDGWVDTVYHRVPFVAYSSTDMGYGEKEGSRMTTAVIDFGRRDSVPPPERLIVTYPIDGQTDVPLGWRHTSEAPDPLPGQPPNVGYPISLHITQPAGSASAIAPVSMGDVLLSLRPDAWADMGLWGRPAAPTDWSLTSATLTNASGAAVPAYVIDESNDAPGYLRADVVFVMAKAFMAANTKYNMHILGIDSRDVPFDVRWSFTTGGGVAQATGGAGGAR